MFSAFRVPRSAFRVPRSAFRVPRSAFRVPRSAYDFLLRVTIGPVARNN
jgi:hypothetical protein